MTLAAAAATGWVLSFCVVLTTHLLLQHRYTCEGALQCICSTLECRRDRTSSCQAQRMCYEQRMSHHPGYEEEGGRSSRSPEGHQSRIVVRGCIDDSTPLLCRNQKPNWFKGAWPLLRCCSENWCNRVNPSESASSGKEPDGDTDYDEDNEYYDEDITSVETSADERGPSNPSADHPKKTSTPHGGHRQKPHDPCDPLLNECPNEPRLTPATLHLIYVLVPISGACALLALCATAFVVLKRGEPPNGHRCSKPSYVYGGARGNGLERDGVQMDLEKNVFACHRKYDKRSVTDALGYRKDPLRTPQDPLRAPQDPLRTPQDPLRTPQDPFETPQDQLKTPKDTPRTLQDPLTCRTPQDPLKTPQDPLRTPQAPAYVDAKMFEA